MIRSSKISLKFSNTNKLNKINNFILEYRNVVEKFVDIFWETKDIPKLMSKEYTNKIKNETWISARSIQSAGKQASAIVRGIKKKNKQRLFIYNKLNSEGQFKKAQKLKKIIDKNKETKPIISTVHPELDSRFVKIDLNNQTSFDGWLHLSSLGNKLKIDIPFKKTKPFNKLMEKGKLKPGIKLSKNKIYFNFEISDIPKKKEGKTIGIDIGINKVFTSSDNQMGKEDKDGWNLSKIQKKLSRRKKGSKGFGRAQEHRKNYIYWSLNQLELKNVKKVKLENIKHLRKNKRTSRFMKHWTYPLIFAKLSSLCEESGVQISYINSTYTSQRCSQCGWVRKTNRKESQFKCTLCGFASDADLNASKNISLNLPAINKEKRLSKSNRTGFYWNEIDKKCIVPYSQKLISYFYI